MQRLQNGKKKDTLDQTDLVWVGLIVLIYGIVSFINLGSIKNPKTFWETGSEGENAVVSLADKQNVSKLRYYTGPRFGTYELYGSEDNVTFNYIGELKESKVFAWEDILINQSLRYLSFKARESDSFIGEVSLYNEQGEKLAIDFATDNANRLVDESQEVPEEISYLNSTYFDEIYHARTAYEHLVKREAYEWTHPPLGKLIMSIPIYFFGMNPFAYRLMGNVAGIGMLIIIYILAKRLFGETQYAVLAAVLLATDGMHFVQTRIATVDSFLVLFLMLSYLFMYQYIRCEDNGDLSKKLICLFLSGIFIGAAIATKWNGVYGAVGLAVIFFMNFYKRCRNKYHNYIWKKQIATIIMSCFIFFVVIPLGIYLLSYKPFFEVEFNSNQPFREFIELQKRMYHYHADLEATHPFSSPWYLWPLDIKPVWYYKGEVAEGFISTIVAFGNPVVWWSGVIGSLYLIKRVLQYREQEDQYVLTGILALYLPYAFIPRIMFLYHYFPIVPFMILALVRLIQDVNEPAQKSCIVNIYKMIAVVSFIFFYPIYSGMRIPVDYAVLTRWLPVWQFY
jgi:dolichyl-phosphate-mannose--protein O-mannosyl transferase